MTRLRLTRSILLWGFLINVAICLFYAFILDAEYPFNSFLFRPIDRFQDFYTVLRATVDLDPYKIRPVINIPGHAGVEVSNYLPLTHILLYPFTLLQPQLALALFTGLSALFFSWGFWLLVRRFELALPVFLFSWLVCVPLNYPILFTWDRGNLESWVFLMVAAGIYLFCTERVHRGAALMGLAGAIKIFPLLFLFPLVREKKLAPLCTGAAVFVFASLASLACFENGLSENWVALQEAFSTFSSFLLAGVNGITHSISLFSAGYSAWVWVEQRLAAPADLQAWLNGYHVFVCAALTAILGYTHFFAMDQWKRWAMLTGAVQILPYPSYDYKLLYSLIPLTFLIADDRSERKYIWLVSLVLVPKAYVLFADVRLSVLINPLLITTIMIMIVADSLKAPPSLRACLKSLKSRREEKSVLLMLRR